MTLQETGAGSLAARCFAYDLFVVHADAPADTAFVEGYLLARLGLEPERVLRLQTLELGQVVTKEIERGVRSSRVTIVVLSAAYMAEPLAAFGERLATYASIAADTHGELLPLLLENCKLTLHMQSLIKLDFRGPSHAAWDAEIDRLRRYLGRPAVPAPELACPYLGMRPFTEGDADRFFGRETELDDIVYRMRQGQREIYVIGASGSGKSSLIDAGLIPRLARGVEGLPRFRVRSFRPGERPSDRLAVALEGDVVTPADGIGHQLTQHVPATPLLLVVDQLEELFAVTGEIQRRRFFAAVRGLRRDPRCVLLFTLRADFYGAFMTSPLWTDNEGRISRIDLGPLASDSLRVVIERPAQDADVHVEPQLVSRLLDDAAREPGALPLLQETLLQLWSKRRHRLLTLADYRALSHGARTGLAAAVEQHADFVLGQLTSAQRLIARRILLRLVNFGEGRADTRRQQSRDALRSAGETAASFDAVLQCLVDHRLLTVTGDDQHGDVRVDLAHEILIEAWSTFAHWIRTWRVQEQRRRELEAAAGGWRLCGGGDDGLLGRVRLAGAIAWREEAARDLGHTADLVAFVIASEAAQVRTSQQRRRTRMLAVAVPLTIIVAAVMSMLAVVARQQRNARDRLVAESARLYQDVGWQQLIENERPLQALPYLVAAREAVEASGGVPSTSLRMLFAAATRNLPSSPWLQHQGAVRTAVFSPDGTRIVTASDDHTARVWDAATGALLAQPLRHQRSVVSAAFDARGTRVVTASDDNTARVWDAASGTLLCTPLLHQAVVVSAEFSPDGTRIVTASWDKTAQIWDAATGKPLLPPLVHLDSVMSASYSPDGSRVVTASSDNAARVWDASTGRPISPPMLHQDTVVSAMFSHDGARVVTASHDRTARVWDAATGRPLSLPLQHQAAVVSAAFSRDGSRVVTASWDNTARVWDAATGKPISPPLQHQEAVVSAAFSFDGARVITASRDRTSRIWDATTGNALSSPLQHQGEVWSVAFSPDGTHAVTASDDTTARTWDATSASDGLALVLQHHDALNSAAFGPGGRRIVTASWDTTARVWDASTGRSLSPPLQHQEAVLSAVFSPEGERVVTASKDRTARVWDVGSGRPLSPPLGHRDSVMYAEFSPDGRRVVTASMDNTAQVWDAATGQRLSRPLRHQDTVVKAIFNPDGTRIATASLDKTARVWDSNTGELLLSLPHQGGVMSAAFSSDGTHIVTASRDDTAQIWEASTGRPLSPPLRHQDAVVGATFNPDGTRVATASWDKTARVWDAATGEPLSPPLPHQGFVASVAFSLDGARLVTTSGDKTARIWDATTGKPLALPLQHRGILTGATFSSDGTRIVTASSDDVALIWRVPLAAGSLTDWRTMSECASPYTVVSGVLNPRKLINCCGAR